MYGARSVLPCNRKDCGSILQIAICLSVLCCVTLIKFNSPSYKIATSPDKRGIHTIVFSDAMRSYSLRCFGRSASTLGSNPMGSIYPVLSGYQNIFFENCPFLEKCSSERTRYKTISAVYLRLCWKRRFDSGCAYCGDLRRVCLRGRWDAFPLYRRNSP